MCTVKRVNDYRARPIASMRLRLLISHLHRGNRLRRNRRYRISQNRQQRYRRPLLQFHRYCRPLRRHRFPVECRDRWHSIICRAWRSFVRDDGMNFWPPNPGLTDISRTMSTLSITWLNQSSGVAGLKTRPALQPCSRIRPRERSTCGSLPGER